MESLKDSPHLTCYRLKIATDSTDSSMMMENAPHTTPGGAEQMAGLGAVDLIMALIIGVSPIGNWCPKCVRSLSKRLLNMGPPGYSIRNKPAADLQGRPTMLP